MTKEREIAEKIRSTFWSSIDSVKGYSLADEITQAIIEAKKDARREAIKECAEIAERYRISAYLSDTDHEINKLKIEILKLLDEK